MKGFGSFLAGFATGWVVRSTVDSSRGVTVGLISTAYAVVDRTKRFVAIEREHLEDLVAEGRSRFEAKRAREASVRGAKGSGPTSPTSAAVVETVVTGRGRAA